MLTKIKNKPVHRAKANIKTNSANLMTLLNMSFGGISIIATINGEMKMAALFIIIAALCDRFDGAIARKFDVASELGAQLDSLCDLVSFGVAPAVLLYTLALNELGGIGAFAALLFIGCGAFRLARFNVINAKGFFIGLPITAAGALVALIILINPELSSWFFFIITLFFSFAMISTVKLKKV